MRPHPHARENSTGPDFRHRQPISPLRLWLLSLFLLLAGCANLAPNPPVSQLTSPIVLQCAQLYETLDHLAQRAAVRDAGSHRLAGYPYFRSSRFLQSFESRLRGEPPASPVYRDWLVRLNLRAVGGLLIEWQRLPAEDRRGLSERVEFPVGSRGNLRQKLRYCGALIVAAVSDNAALKNTLLAAARVPDHYSTWKRWLGLYSLAAIPFSRGVNQEHESIAGLQEEFRQRRIDGQAWQFYQYQPGNSVQPVSGQNTDNLIDAQPLSFSQSRHILRELRLDRLGIPQLGVNQKNRLLATWAPKIAIERGGEEPRANVIGGLHRDGGEVDIELERPTLYSYISFGRLGDAVTLQLNYNFWFSERPKRRWLDGLAGKLDGLTWRIHLSLEGELLAMDSIHNCGCWYQLYVRDEADWKPERMATGVEPVFRASLPQAAFRQPLTLFLQADTHTLLGVRQAPDAVAQPLQMRPYRQLRLDGIFNQAGLIPTSRRLERFLFWPMGISSPGAMRQAGTHAIAFIGRRHFDDPYLLSSLGLESHQSAK